MSRTILGVGRLAIRQAAQILAEGRLETGAPLGPGAEWNPDRLLLSAGRGSVRFLAGNILYEEDPAGFLRHEFRSNPRPPVRKAAWLAGLSRYELPFSMTVAAELSARCEISMSGRFFLESFCRYYCGHRTDIESTARDLRHVLDAFLLLQRWPGLFEACVNSLGPQLASGLPKGAMPQDLGTFLGRLVVGDVELRALPDAVREIREGSSSEAQAFRLVRHHGRMMDSLEHFGARVAPSLERLRTEIIAILQL